MIKTEMKPAVDARCPKCHTHYIFTELVENEVDGDCWFLVCEECGFDWEAQPEDLENENDH